MLMLMLVLVLVLVLVHGRCRTALVALLLHSVGQC